MTLNKMLNLNNAPQDYSRKNIKVKKEKQTMKTKKENILVNVILKNTTNITKQRFVNV